MTTAEARKLWVEALRSGDYPQTTGTLRDEHGYCCLGVACEIAVQNGVIKPATATCGLRYVYGYADGVLPRSVKQWLGLATADGGFLTYDRTSLARMNDAGAPFEDIADVIEREPDGLVVR
jgi:hypothetical protein